MLPRCKCSIGLGGIHLPILQSQRGIMRILGIIGLLLVVSGLFFAGQGTGYIPWPQESFMVNNGSWLYYGLGIAVAGLIFIIMARR
jgi:hypothetical protein